jgi:diaminopimelate decarboxylase
MNIDVIADAIYLPPLPVGGRLVISPVGAYNMTQWMQFITCRPAVVMIMENGSIECIRRAETLDDINRCESIPQSLYQNP